MAAVEPRPVHREAQPFLLAAGPVACLLVHGFTATPKDMRFLAERLHAHGYTARAVRLAGHGTSVEDLERCRWTDWYASAVNGLSELRQRSSHIVVVGQSMGALLALKLAADHAAVVSGVALLAPALVLRNRWLRWIAPLLRVLPALVGERARHVGRGESDIADPEARANSSSYRRVPLAALSELLRLQKHVRALLPHVRQPTLIVHSRNDHTCPLANVTLLQRKLRGPARTVVLHDSYHVISVDVDKERVAAEIAAFVERTASQ